MKKQKVLSLILAAALCVGTPASAMAAEFSSGSENDAVQVITEVATEDAFTDSTDTTEETTENAEVTEFAPEVEEKQEDVVDEELNRIVGLFKLSREQGYTLKLIPGTPEENAPVFDFENERILRPAA